MNNYCQKYLDNFCNIDIKASFDNSRKVTAVIVETRIDPNIILVLKNFLFFFNDINLLVFCTKKLYNLVKCSIGDNFLFIDLKDDQITIDKYNDLLKSLYFWNNIPGDNVFVFQKDCIFFRGTDFKKFSKYGMIGPVAGFFDDVNFIINGGLGLRRKEVMIELIKEKNKLTLHNNLTFKKIKNLLNINDAEKYLRQEDVFFTIAIREIFPNLMPTYDDCLNFAIESIGNPMKAIGLHGTDKNYFSEELLKQALAFTDF